MTASTTAIIGADSLAISSCGASTEDQLDTVLIKTASRCNIDCSYCYVYQGPDTTWRTQPKRMRPDVLAAVRDRLIEQAEQQPRGFAIVLHGGEPLLLGFNYLASFLHGLRARLCPQSYPISIQTNGTLITQDLLDLFAETSTSVSVSIDGPPKVNNLARLDHLGKSTFERTVRGIRLLSAHPKRTFLFAGTLSVIHPTSEPRIVYEFLKSLDTPGMDFLLQDGNHNCLPPGKKHFGSTEYGQWLVGLFDLYFADSSPVPIRIVDDLIKLCLGGKSQKEGHGKSPYGILIIETNGDIRKNDTLRTSFEGADRFSQNWNVSNTPISKVLLSNEFNTYAQMQTPASSKCQRCQLLHICGGGMPLYRWSSDRGYGNPSIYCHDHEVFIRHALARLRDFGLHKLSNAL